MTDDTNVQAILLIVNNISIWICEILVDLLQTLINILPKYLK